MRTKFFYTFFACLVSKEKNEKVLLDSLKHLLISKTVPKAASNFCSSCPSFSLVYFLHSWLAFGTIFRITGSFRINFQLLEPQAAIGRLPREGYWKDFQNSK
jgi:hypothetical protein